MFFVNDLNFDLGIQSRKYFTLIFVNLIATSELKSPLFCNDKLTNESMIEINKDAYLLISSTT